MLTVFDVGQGDSLLLQPKDCLFGGNPLLVDTGPLAAKVAARISENTISVLLTHSHADHIGGLSGVISRKEIRKLYLPYYLPEVLSIHKFIQRYSTTKIGRLSWNKINNLNVRLVSDGDKLCDHITVFNPPKDPQGYFSAFLDDNNRHSIKRALYRLSNLGIDLPSDDIINYETPLKSGSTNNDAGSSDYRYNAKAFVHMFFISLSNRICARIGSRGKSLCSFSAGDGG